MEENDVMTLTPGIPVDLAPSATPAMPDAHSRPHYHYTGPSPMLVGAGAGYLAGGLLGALAGAIFGKAFFKPHGG